MRPTILQPMHVDPAYARLKNHNGSWYGAAETAEGEVLLLGSLGLEAHVELNGLAMQGRYEAGSGEWFVAMGEEAEVFARYAELLKVRFGKGRAEKPPRVWCSWYSLYREISEERLLKILGDLGDLPFEVFQVDDGWQVGIGDWEAKGKFPSGMDGLAKLIRATGRTPGLWLAPLIVVPSSSLYREHLEWLLRDEQGRLVPAGVNWGEQLYALDTTHLEVMDWLIRLMKQVRAWGYDYLKLDFLSAGALPGKRHVDTPRETAYRQCLSVIRETLGDAYFLTCGAPILPSLGLCDGMRVGPDVSEEWESFLFTQLLMDYSNDGSRSVLRTVLSRLWLQPLLHTDPDAVFFRTYRNHLTAEQKRLLQDLALIAGFKSTSDVPAWMTEAERSNLRDFLEANPAIKRVGRTSFLVGGRRVDFGPFIQTPGLPVFPLRILGAMVGALANNRKNIDLFDRLASRSLRKGLAAHPV